MTKKTLGSIVTISKGKKHSVTEEYSTKSKRLIGIDDLRNDDLIRYTDDKNGTEALPEDVLIAWDGANAGTIGFGKSGFIGSTIARLRINQGMKIYTPFLGSFLKSKFDYLRQTATGATIPHVNRKALDSILLPPVDFDDQIRIAHLLGKVEGLIAQRKENLLQLDELLKSVFLKMFGDPVRNEKGWETSDIESLCECVIDCPHSTPIYSNEQTYLYCIRSSDIQNGALNLNNTYQVEEAVFIERIKRYTPLVGDIVYSREGGRLGNAARIIGSEKICLGQRMMLFKPNSGNKSEFIWALLESVSFKQKLHGLVGGGAAPRVNIKDLKQILVIRPPLHHQRTFATIVQKVESIKSHYQHSLTGLENLYGALSQKAFKGELDLSRVVVTTEQAETRGKVVPFRQGFARQLLAAEILNRHNNDQMTQMKLQKLIHLTEYHAQLDEIQGDYQRQAAGPYDNRLMYGLAAGLEKQHWFKIYGHGQKATYSPLGKAGNHQKYLSHWQDNIEKIDEVLNLLGKLSPERCEIVSTLYAAWNDLLIEGAQISDERIITEASHPDRWHQAKAAIDPTKWPKALDWMREHNLIPSGYGKQTRKL